MNYQSRVPRESRTYFIDRKNKFVKALELQKPQALAKWEYWEIETAPSKTNPEKWNGTTEAALPGIVATQLLKANLLPELSRPDSENRTENSMHIVEATSKPNASPNRK